VGSAGALLVSAAAAVGVVGALWFLSRTERRDRRRVLGVLALYAAASVGLSAVSAAATGTFGYASNWAATATFLEESGEALAGVGFLMAVLVGVAPRLVLPAGWALRRSADAHTLELPEQLPGRTADGPAGI
jgi:O-antigen ligase